MNRPECHGEWLLWRAAEGLPYPELEEAAELLAGEYSEEVKEILDGVQRDKPNHELRKICTHETAAVLGDAEAMARTGHSDPRMLDVYRQRGGKLVHRVV